MNEVGNTKPKPLSIKRVGNLLILAGAAVSVATVAGFAGTVWWRTELACHFRVQYFISLAIVALTLALLRRWRFAAVFGTFISHSETRGRYPDIISPTGTRPSITMMAATSSNVASRLRARKVRTAAEAMKNPSMLNMVAPAETKSAS